MPQEQTYFTQTILLRKRNDTHFPCFEGIFLRSPELRRGAAEYSLTQAFFHRKFIRRWKEWQKIYLTYNALQIASAISFVPTAVGSLRLGFKS